MTSIGPPTYGGELFDGLERLPRKILKYLFISTIIVIFILYYTYYITNEPVILIVIFLVLASLPVDAALVYGLSHSHYKKIKQFFTSIIELLDAEAYGVLRYAGYTLLAVKRRSGELVNAIMPDSNKLYLIIVKEFSSVEESNARSLRELVSLSLYLGRSIGILRNILKTNKITLKCVRTEKEVRGELRVLDPYRPVVKYGHGRATVVFFRCPRGMSSLQEEVTLYLSGAV